MVKGREEAGEIAGAADESRDHVHDAEKEPGVPIKRLRQHHPIPQQKTEAGEKEHQHNVHDPVGEVRGNPAERHQVHLRGVHTSRPGAVEHGDGVSRPIVEGLADQVRHAGVRHAVHGHDLILGLHACPHRLGERLYKITGAMRILERRTRAIGVEKGVKGRSGAGRVEEHRTRNQDGQQQVRKFG